MKSALCKLEVHVSAGTIPKSLMIKQAISLPKECGNHNTAIQEATRAFEVTRLKEVVSAKTTQLELITSELRELSDSTQNSWVKTIQDLFDGIDAPGIQPALHATQLFNDCKRATMLRINAAKVTASKKIKVDDSDKKLLEKKKNDMLAEKDKSVAQLVQEEVRKQFKDRQRDQKANGHKSHPTTPQKGKPSGKKGKVRFSGPAMSAAVRPPANSKKTSQKKANVNKQKPQSKTDNRSNGPFSAQANSTPPVMSPNALSNNSSSKAGKQKNGKGKTRRQTTQN